jgi:succinoglycan biosynthesis transport protein ExoP
MIDESGRPGGPYERGYLAPRHNADLVTRDRPGALGFFPLDGEEMAPVGFQPLHYLQIVLKHWLVVVAAVLISLAVGVAITLLTQPIYTAQVTLQIDKEAPKVVEGDTLQPRESGSYEEFFQTQYGLLKSRSLAARTVDAAGLASDPNVLKAYGFKPSQAGSAAVRESMTNIVQGSLTVAPVQRSRLVAVAYSSPSPQVSALIANAVTENFIQSNLDRRFESSAYARQFLEQRLAQTRAKLEATERQLVAYAQNQQIINLPVGDEAGGGSGATQSLTATNLSALNAALTTAQAERIRAEERWRRSQGSASGGLQEVLQSGTIQGLTTARTALEAEYQQKLQVYKPEYPEMLQLRARIAELDRQKAIEIGNVRNSLRNQYEVALAQERSFQRQVAGLKTSVLDLRGRSIQYDILQREVDTNRTLYEGLLQRYKEIGVVGGLSTNNVSIVDQAQPPGGPSQPQPMQNLMAALAIGLLLGVGLAFLLETMDESIGAPHDVEKKLGLPLLGAVPKLDKGVTPMEALADIRSAFAEAYYSVQTALQFSTEHGIPRTMVVVSARPSEGKSTSATAIARYLARLGSRVLLVDGDLRNPSLHRLLEADSSAGLSNFLSSGSTLKELIQVTDTPNLSFMSSGPVPPSPAELIAGPRVVELLKEAREIFDIVVIDGPPVMGLADAPLLASRVDGTVMVVEAGGAGRNVVRAAINRLRVGNARVLGVILTKFEGRKNSYGYGYGYGYGQDFDYGAKPVLGSK